ncbi:hypothetical protein [Halosimplex marinum]|uniref:hypothetical protein n=1 Tax=Halosimplex marinum TaxID=3396620 RepID=UPI003F56DAA3
MGDVSGYPLKREADRRHPTVGVTNIANDHDQARYRIDIAEVVVGVVRETVTGVSEVTDDERVKRSRFGCSQRQGEFSWHSLFRQIPTRNTEDPFVYQQ